jgi:hypothetical protein
LDGRASASHYFFFYHFSLAFIFDLAVCGSFFFFPAFPDRVFWAFFFFPGFSGSGLLGVLLCDLAVMLCDLAVMLCDLAVCGALAVCGSFFFPVGAENVCGVYRRLFNI